MPEATEPLTQSVRPEPVKGHSEERKPDYTALTFPDPPPDRPYVIVNMVSSVDSFETNTRVRSASPCAEPSPM